MVVKVLIVDNVSAVRQGLRMFLQLEADFEIVGEASNGEDAVRLADLLQPDVILIDLIMPVMNGLEATKNIRQKHPRTIVIMLTNSNDSDQIQAAHAAGVHAYVQKTISPDELLRTIRDCILHRSN